VVAVVWFARRRGMSKAVADLDDGRCE